MKNLPIGKQELSKLINDNCIYVDKTEAICKLITDGSYYFLSRPRRFGKSLLINTLKEIFDGNKALFEGLWIYDKIEWTKYPIIHLDFSKINHKELGLHQALSNEIDAIALANNLILNKTALTSKFEELIVSLNQGKGTVILVDEYDKPLIDYIENEEKAKENREILKNFFSIIKGNDRNIKFLLITGVSKFTQVSIFSDLNNLNDITLNDKYANMLGYTQQELEFYFKEHLALLAEKFKNVYPDVLPVIKEWYNGYSWNGTDFVYNPFSILNLFENQKFKDYWFQTGTPTFLMKLLRKNKYTLFDLTNKEVNDSIFNKFDITNIEVNSLLFQTGYLTIKSANLVDHTVTLDFPNREVASSFTTHLLAEFSEYGTEKSNMLLIEIIRALRDNDMEEFQFMLKSLFEIITYPNIDNTEKYYHSIFYMALKMIGFTIESEVVVSRGRIDAVLKTPANIYVIEFKLGDAKKAIQQIKDKQYHAKYLMDRKPITLLGIGFDVEKKNIGSFEVEEIKIA